jgi:hypothetical protein
VTEGSSSQPGNSIELFVEVAPDYLDVPLSTGDTVRVYRVPETLIQTIKPERPKPKRPTVDMVTKTGPQPRPAKAGDPEYDVWSAEMDEWEQEYEDLKEAVTFVLALKDVEYPDEEADKDAFEDALPNDVFDMVDMGLTEIPTDPLQRQVFFLRSVLMRSMIDEMQINLALQRLSGVPKEMIDQIKANFRRGLLGPQPDAVGPVPEDSNGPESD